MTPPAASHATAVIPARFASTRFPGKPLVPLLGKAMVCHVVDRCLESGVFQRVIVATDDERVAAAVRAAGGEAVLTSPACQSGTDRVAEVVRKLEAPAPEVVVNVQGDEPAIEPRALADLVACFREPQVSIATLVRPLQESERGNPNVVKVVLGLDRFALYFSRSDIPHARGAEPSRWAHLGVYAYRRDALLRFAALPPSPLEQVESLEQLRALENGMRIACVPTEHASVGVDRPEDVAAAEALLAARFRTGAGSGSTPA